MSRSNFAIRCTKNVQKSTEPLFLPFYGPWKYIFVEYSLLVVFILFFCGIFLQPKRVWKEKGRLGRLCCGDQSRSGSKERFWYTDACCDGPDGSVHSNRLTHVVCLIANLLPFISIVTTGAFFFWGISLPSGPNRERTPFRFLECDVQGGDADQIKGGWSCSSLPLHLH